MNRAVVALLIMNVLCTSFSSYAEDIARASYVFRPSQSGIVPDESGNKHDASAQLDGTDGWVDTDVGPAVTLKNTGELISIPFSAFPGKKGAVRIVFRPDSHQAESQYLFRLYSGTGDGLTLYLHEGNFSFRYYNRVAKTNTVAKLPVGVVNPGEWTTATLSWDLETAWRIQLQVDEKRKVIQGVNPEFQVQFDPDSVMVIGSEHSGEATFFGTIHSFEVFDKPLWEDVASSDLKKKVPAEISKTARQRVLPRTLFFSRTQPKYNLFDNTLQRRWVDRPLFFDRRTAVGDKPFEIVNCASFLKTQKSLRAYKLDGLGSLVAFIPQQGTAFLEMLDCVEAHPESCIPLVMELGPANTEAGAAERLKLFLPLAKLAVKSPGVRRVSGKVLVLSYALDSESIESWTAFQQEVKEQVGDEFLFVTDVTTRRPALLREFQELGGLSQKSLDDFREHLRAWLKVSDGIMWAGGSHTNRDDGTLDREFYRDLLVPVFSEVLNEPANKNKLLGLDAEVGYINMMTSRRVNSEEGTQRLRDNLEIALEAQADFVTMPEWDELNENTSIGPTLTNSLSTQRIVRHYVQKFAGEQPELMPGDNVAIPNVIVSFRPYLKLGSPLEVEVLSLPEGVEGGKLQVALSLKNLSGAVVKTFPAVSLPAGELAAHVFRMPSEELAHEAVLIPALEITAQDGSVSRWEEGLESIRLFPSWNLNYKATKMPLRDLLQPTSARFALASEQTGDGVQLEGSVVCDEPIMSVEVTQDSRELYAVDAGEELTPRDGEALVQLQWQAMRNPMPFTGTITVEGGEMRRFVDWTRPEYKPLSYRLAAETGQDGRKEVSFVTDKGVNSTNARGGFFLITNPEEAVISMRTNLFQTTFPVKEILATGKIVKVFPHGLTVEATRMDLLPQVPLPLLRKEVAFSATVHPWRKDAPLQMRVVTESGKIYRSHPVMPFPLSEKTVQVPVWSETADRPVEVTVSTSRVPDLPFEMGGRTDALLPVSGSGYFRGLAGGVPFDMGAFAKRYLKNIYPASTANTSPQRVMEGGVSCLQFDGKGNFLYFPEETLPRGTFTLEFEIKPTADTPQILFVNRGYLRGALTLTLQNGRLGGQWLDRNDKVTELSTDLEVPVGKWSTIRVEYDLQQLHFTVNGKTQSFACAGGPSKSIAAFIFGGYGNGKAVGYFSGFLKNLSVRHTVTNK